MALYRIFTHHVGIQYKNTLCSKATYFVLITTIIALIFPLVIAFRSRGFWLKNFIFYEQPDVQFKYEYLFIAETDSINETIACGSLPNLTTILHNQENCYNLKLREDDFNFDSKIDEITIDLLINNPKFKNIQAMNFFLIFKFQLQGVCPLEMESLVALQHSFGLPASGLQVTGNLNFIQVAALPCWFNYKDTRFATSVLNKNMDESNVQNILESVLHDYARRPVTTKLSDEYFTIRHGVSSQFEMKMSIAVPELPIRFRPGLWQELKYSWQQYFSIAVIFYWLLIKVKAYVFTNHILPVWEHKPWTKDY